MDKHVVKEMTFEEFCLFSGISPDCWVFINKNQKNTFWQSDDGCVYFDNGIGVIRKFEKINGSVWFSLYLGGHKCGEDWTPWRVW